MGSKLFDNKKPLSKKQQDKIAREKNKDLKINKAPAKFIGGRSKDFDKVDNEFYATNPTSLEALFKAHPKILEARRYLEPCVGQGHIADTIKKHNPRARVKGYDLVDRGYPKTIVSDYTKSKPLKRKVDWTITNPPFTLASDFVHKALEDSKIGVAMFLKIQFLETVKRKELLENTPLKYIYIFSKRQVTFREGLELDPRTNKPWSNMLCFCWLVWEKDYEGEPIVRWL
jgi:hypothetical protein